MSEHSAAEARVSTEEVGPACSGCGRPMPAYQVGDFIEVELTGKRLPALIVTVSMDQRTFSVAVAGYDDPLAYGNPEYIPGAEKFLLKPSSLSSATQNGENRG